MTQHAQKQARRHALRNGVSVNNAMIILALAGFSELSEEDVRRLGWVILSLATILPACLTLLTGAWRDPLFFGLAVVQGAAMFFSLRAIFRYMQRRGCTEFSTSGVTSLAYFPVCLLTNALWGLGLTLCQFLR